MLAQMPRSRKGCAAGLPALLPVGDPALACELGEARVARGAERGERVLAGRHARGHAQPDRVHVLAVALDPEADVRAGREPGLARVADHLLLLDAVAHAQAVGIAREVGIRGDVAVLVADL